MIEFSVFKGRIKKLLLKEGIEIKNDQIEKLFEYRKLLNEWNSKINLYSKGDESMMEEKHFVDSIVPYGKIERAGASRITDIGSGNGFPALPLSIMLPGTTFTLIEKRQKRAAFLKEAVHFAKLKNIKVLCMDAEDFDWSETELITGRAFKNAETMKEILKKWNCFSSFMIWDRRDGERATLYRYDEKCSTWNIEV